MAALFPPLVVRDAPIRPKSRQELHRPAVDCSSNGTKGRRERKKDIFCFSFFFFLFGYSLEITSSSKVTRELTRTTGFRHHAQLGYQRNSCGYCKSNNGSMSHSVASLLTAVNGASIPLNGEFEILTHYVITFLVLSGVSYYASSLVVRPNHYEELIHRGWRRYDYPAGDREAQVINHVWIQVGQALLQAEPAKIMLSALHYETRGQCLSTSPGPTQSDQSLEQVHLGPRVSP